MIDQARIRVLSVDDHPFLRSGISTIINDQPDMLVVAEAANGHDAIQQFRMHRPDVTLMDLKLPDLSGIDTMIAIRLEFPDARIVMLTTYEGDIDMQRAFTAGGRGFMLETIGPAGLLTVICPGYPRGKQAPAVLATTLSQHHPVP